MRSFALTVCLLLSGCLCGAPGSLEIVGDNPLDFGGLAMGAQHKLRVELRNPGSRSIEITAIDRAENGAFITDFMPVSIKAESSIFGNVTFAPPVDPDGAVTETDHTSELTFRTTTGALELSMKGKAVRGKCGPLVVDFGAVVVGHGKAQQVSFELPPGVTAPPRVDRVAGQGFTAAAASSLLELFFSPPRAGDFSGLATFAVGPQCLNGLEVQLRGTGVDALLEFEPSLVDFGYVPPGLTKSATVRVRNYGDAAVQLTDVKTEGIGSSSNFRITDGVTSLRLPPASHVSGQRIPGEIELSLSFSPRTPGREQGALRAETSADLQPAIACPLVGRGGGPDIDVRPTAVDFGQVPVFAGTGVTRKVNVRNLGSFDNTSAANLHIARWVITPKNAASRADDLCVGDWSSSTSTCMNRLPAGYDPVVGIAARPGAELDIPIRVMPSVTGDLEWDVTFHSDDLDEPTVTVNVRVRGVTLPACDLAVGPSVLSFGLLSSRPRALSVTLTNFGLESCLISWLDLDPNTPSAFTLLGGPVDNRVLLPGASMFVLVQATPPANVPTAIQTLTGGLTVHVNTPGAPRRQVPLTAQLGTGCLMISPTTSDFGMVKKDCTSERRVFHVFNTCSTGVTVQSFGVSAAAPLPFTPACPGSMPCPELRLSGSPGFTVGTVLMPASTTTFALDYRPLDLGPDRGSFALRVDEGGNAITYVVTVSGAGDIAGVNTESFVQQSPNKTDVLFVVDNSSSMADEQQALAQNLSDIESFVQYANAAGIDFRFGVTVTDLTTPTVGALVGTPAVLTNGTPNLGSLLSSRMLVGTTGSLTRGVAEPAVRALSMRLLPGFLRDDARLAIIGITDGPDRSPASAGLYEAMLLELKNGNRTAVSYSVIGPSWPAQTGCNTDDPWPSASKLRALTLAFSGSHSAICNVDWSAALGAARSSTFGLRRTFQLRGEPDASTGIVVKLDNGSGPVVLDPVDSRGATVWTYDAIARAVVIEPLFVPAAGDVLIVTYTAVCR